MPRLIIGFVKSITFSRCDVIVNGVDKSAFFKDKCFYLNLKF